MDGGPGDALAPAPAAGARPDGATAGRALARAGLVVTAAFLASRVLGYVRYIAIAGAVPVGPELDAFFAAFRIPDLLFQLVAAGALSSSLIPVVAALLATGDDDHAWRVVSAVGTLVLAVLAVLAALVLVAAPVLVPLIAPGFDAATTARTVELTRLMVLAPLLLAAGSVATSALNARGSFAAAAAAPLLYNLGIIAGAVVLVPVLGTAGLAAGVVLGAAGHVAVQAPSLRRAGVGLRPRLGLGDPQARRALALMAPRALGLGATQLVFVVLTGLASTLEPGSISVFNLAFAVLQIPIGVIGVPLGIVLLPSLSREVALGGGEAFRRLLLRALGLLAFVMAVLAVLGTVVADDLVRLLFVPGGVAESDLRRTALTLAVFLAGLPAHALIAVLARAFYARQDTATPVLAALVAVAVDIAAALVLVGPLGLPGLAAAVALGAWCETLTLGVLLGRRVPGLGLRHVARVLARSLVAAAAGALAALAVDVALAGAWGAVPAYPLVAARAVLTVAAGGLVTIAAARALRIEELGTIVGVVADLLRRRGRA